MAGTGDRVDSRTKASSEDCDLRLTVEMEFGDRDVRVRELQSQTDDDMYATRANPVCNNDAIA
jgi:hypothetical protein